MSFLVKVNVRFYIPMIKRCFSVGLLVVLNGSSKTNVFCPSRRRFSKGCWQQPLSTQAFNSTLHFGPNWSDTSKLWQHRRQLASSISSRVLSDCGGWCQNFIVINAARKCDAGLI